MVSPRIVRRPFALVLPAILALAVLVFLSGQKRHTRTAWRRDNAVRAKASRQIAAAISVPKVVEKGLGAAGMKAKVETVKTAPETVKKTVAETSAQTGKETAASEKPVTARTSPAEGKGAACAAFDVKTGAWAISRVTKNVRAVADLDIISRAGVVVRAKVWHATGRPFVVASRSDIDALGVRLCLVEAGRAMVAAPVVADALATNNMDGGVHAVGGVDGRLVEREASWSEGKIEDGLRLEIGERFVLELGKVYLDVDEVWDSVGVGKVPFMRKEEHDLWARVSEAFYGGGRHLDWGTGSSSHFACGFYRFVNAIDSQVKWCDVTAKGISAEQNWCKAISMRCLDVGELAPWGNPKKGVTDTPYYFHRYVAQIDYFRDSPYYDTILVDGRFRTACAIKALGYLRRDSLLIMHDWPRSYEPVLKYVKLVAKNASLAVFTPRDDLEVGADDDYRLFPGVTRR